MSQWDTNAAYGYELLQGDCLNGMRDIPAGTVQTILTDPPFSSGGPRGH